MGKRIAHKQQHQRRTSGPTIVCAVFFWCLAFTQNNEESNKQLTIDAKQLWWYINVSVRPARNQEWFALFTVRFTCTYPVRNKQSNSQIVNHWLPTADCRLRTCILTNPTLRNLQRVRGNQWRVHVAWRSRRASENLRMRATIRVKNACIHWSWSVDALDRLSNSRCFCSVFSKFSFLIFHSENCIVMPMTNDNDGKSKLWLCIAASEKRRQLDFPDSLSVRCANARRETKKKWFHFLSLKALKHKRAHLHCGALAAKIDTCTRYIINARKCMFLAAYKTAHTHTYTHAQTLTLISIRLWKLKRKKKKKDNIKITFVCVSRNLAKVKINTKRLCIASSTRCARALEETLASSTQQPPYFGPLSVFIYCHIISYCDFLFSRHCAFSSMRFIQMHEWMCARLNSSNSVSFTFRHTHTYSAWSPVSMLFWALWTIAVWWNSIWLPQIARVTILSRLHSFALRTRFIYKLQCYFSNDRIRGGSHNIPRPRSVPYVELVACRSTCMHVSAKSKVIQTQQQIQTTWKLSVSSIFFYLHISSVFLSNVSHTDTKFTWCIACTSLADATHMLQFLNGGVRVYCCAKNMCPIL